MHKGGKQQSLPELSDLLQIDLQAHLESNESQEPLRKEMHVLEEMLVQYVCKGGTQDDARDHIGHDHGEARSFELPSGRVGEHDHQAQYEQEG